MKQNVQNGTSPNSEISNQKAQGLKTKHTTTISNSDISQFIKLQISDEADYERHSLDFSKGQILYDKGDKKIGSNNISDGVVSMKPHGSSYFSRVSQENFTKDSKNGYIAIKDHVVTVIGESVYDGLANIEDVGFYSKTLHNMVNKDFFDLQYNKKNYKKDSWTEVKLSSEGETTKTRVFAMETALEKLEPENFVVKAFIQNGRFGHQNNCALITNFLLVLKSAFKDENKVDEALFSLIGKTTGLRKIKINEVTNYNGITVCESNPRLDVRSVRAFFATFLSARALYESKGIDITKNQDLYTKIVSSIVENFKPLPKDIKDDVNDKLFWNLYQKPQLEKSPGANEKVSAYR